MHEVCIWKSNGRTRRKRCPKIEFGRREVAREMGQSDRTMRYRATASGCDEDYCPL